MLAAQHGKGRTMKPMAILVQAGAMRLSKAAGFLAAAVVLSMAHAGTAHAQMINPFGGYNGPTLSNEDYKIAGSAVSKLLNEQPPKLGSTADWSNPATGNHGTLTLLDVYTSKGMPCRKVKGDVIYGKTSSAPRSNTLSACQVPGGQWKTTE